jgi:peroxiredoxin
MNTKFKSILMALLLCISLAITISGCSSSSNGDIAAVGKKAPEFSLHDLDGDTVSLSDFHGSPILINFWYTGCPPCREEMPYLQEINSEMRDDGLIILAINGGESAGTIAQFLDDNDLPLLFETVLLDQNFSTFEKYQIQFYPTSFFVDRDGIIKEKVIGAFQSKGAIEKRLDKIMA